MHGQKISLWYVFTVQIEHEVRRAPENVAAQRSNTDAVTRTMFFWGLFEVPIHDCKMAEVVINRLDLRLDLRGCKMLDRFFTFVPTTNQTDLSREVKIVSLCLFSGPSHMRYPLSFPKLDTFTLESESLAGCNSGGFSQEGHLEPTVVRCPAIFFKDETAEQQEIQG